MNLSTPIQQINRIGLITAKKLSKIGIKTVRDLLFYFPFRYDSFNQIKIKDLTLGQQASISGIIEIINNQRSRRSKMNITEAFISDGEDILRIIWFNQPFLTKNLKPGDRVFLAGRVEEDFKGLVIKSPTYEKYNKYGNIHTQGMVPVYHLTSNLTQKQLRFQIKQVLELLKEIPDWIPQKIIKSEKLISLDQALRKIHFPNKQEDIELARQRLIFDELFLLQLQIQSARADLETKKSSQISFHELETKKFVNNLPFQLTADQKKTSWEILQDMQKEKPMTRLLEGDVGSGKTIVALLAVLNVLLNNFQVVLLVPTELLAKQHYNLILKLFADFNFKSALFTSNNRLISGVKDKISKNEMKEKIAHHDLDFIIGTHTLIQEDLQFANLGLLIIDEQHRFGVEQRHKIFQKTTNNLIPHLLTMTATPIPRSLALALYDDLDISIIKHLPLGRKKVFTKIINEKDRNDMYNFVQEKLKIGEQVFIVCPLIDDSDKLKFKSVKEEYKRISQNIFPNQKVSMLHGKMKIEEKNKILEDFLKQKIEILVATPVIEVGIDIPKATIMIIENAERFGLAQLHQYRGRVGRNDQQSFCFLVSQSNNARLQAMLKYDNGFDLAKADLQFRGPGEVYGVLQKGFPQFKIASLFDFQIMQQAKKAAKKLLQTEDLVNFPAIKEKFNEIKFSSHLE